MKKNNLEKLNLTLYSETLKNGLQVYIVPKDNVNSIYATLTTKFGSINQEFVPIDGKKMVKVPLGVAHFLEHKVFEQKSDKDPFTFYSERGCDANANTSNYKTTYLYSGANFFDECINYLLDYVEAPYFTDENVEKEKGIIEQEISMYEDDPFFRLYNGLVYNSFIKHPIRYPISGTVSDIRKITKEDLYTCYNTFYHPSNMFLIITGCVDPKKAIKVIRENQDKKKFEPFKPIKIKEYDEPNKVFKEREEISMDLQIPKVGIGYKIDCSKFKEDINLLKTYLSILFDLKIGVTSVLNEQLKNLNLITNDLDFTMINTDKHILISIMTETNDIDKVLNLIQKELEDLTISEQDLERKKKVRKSSCVFRSDSIYSINSKIMNNVMSYGKVILDNYKEIDKLNIKTMNNIIKNINLDNKSIYVITKS